MDESRAPDGTSIRRRQQVRIVKKSEHEACPTERAEEQELAQRAAPLASETVNEEAASRAAAKPARQREEACGIGKQGSQALRTGTALNTSIDPRREGSLVRVCDPRTNIC